MMVSTGPTVLLLTNEAASGTKTLDASHSWFAPLVTAMAGSLPMSAPPHSWIAAPRMTDIPMPRLKIARCSWLNPSVNAVATVIIVLVAIGTVIASYLIARAERERAKAIAQAQRADG